MNLCKRQNLIVSKLLNLFTMAEGTMAERPPVSDDAGEEHNYETLSLDTPKPTETRRPCSMRVIRKRVPWIIVFLLIAVLFVLFFVHTQTGSSGPRGPSGPLGEAGPRGRRGYSGSPGPRGSPGERGPRGRDGNGCLFGKDAPVIEVGMDSTNGGNIPACGVHGEVRASGTPGPRIQRGKFNNAIYLPNEHKDDDNCIDLGIDTGYCPYSLTLCPKGLTVSIWYKIDPNMDWLIGALVSGRDWHFRMKRRNETVGYKPFVVFQKNDTYSRVLWGQSYLQLNEWHQVAFVFHDFENTKLFIDGQLHWETTRPSTHEEKSQINLKVGCEVGCGHAARVTFDQLQIWDYVKSDEEIANVYNFGE